MSKYATVYDKLNNKHTILVDEKFEARLFIINNSNTFVFISKELYATLDEGTINNMNLPDEDESLTPDEMLAKNIMYILEDEYFDREEFITLVENYANKWQNFLIISEIK